MPADENPRRQSFNNNEWLLDDRGVSDSGKAGGPLQIIGGDRRFAHAAVTPTFYPMSPMRRKQASLKSKKDLRQIRLILR